MRVKKWLIGPGTYWYADEASGLPRSLHVTPELVDGWLRSGKEMLAAKLSIPVPLEHQKEALPQTPSERAANRLRNNAGEVADYVKEGDDLYSVLDIQDDDIARKIPKTIRWTSPYISSFTDGDGRKWDGVISHVALTTRPRIVRQQPFPTVAAAMAFSATQPVREWSPSLVPPRGGIALSRAGRLVVEDGKPPRPAYPLAFSLFAGGIALADTPPEKKEPPPAADGKDGKPPATPPGPDGAPPEKSLVDADGDVKITDVLCDLLDMMGVCLPEGTTPENFNEALYRAVIEHHKGKNGDPMTDPKTPDPSRTPPPASKTAPPPGTPPPAPPPVRQESPPLYMGLSLEQAKEQAAKVQDPAVAALLQAAFSMHESDRKELASLRQDKVDRAAAERRAKVEALGKRGSQGFRDKLTALLAAPSMALSLSNEGAVVDPMASMLDVLEAGVRDLPALLTASRSELQQLAHPTEYAGEAVTEERAQAAADGLLAGMAGVAPKKAG